MMSFRINPLNLQRALVATLSRLVQLKPGLHPFRIEYCQTQGLDDLQLKLGEVANTVDSSVDVVLVRDETEEAAAADDLTPGESS